MRVRVADFTRDYAAIRKIRFAVFVDEQRVPETLEMDDRDAHCLHVLAVDDAGRPVGTGRLDVDAGGKIGRVAVLAAARRHGVGTAIMRRLHALALESGCSTVWCHAQRSAEPFYLRLGYRVTSAPFAEAGIEHVRMERASPRGPHGLPLN